MKIVFGFILGVIAGIGVYSFRETLSIGNEVVTEGEMERFFDNYKCPERSTDVDKLLNEIEQLLGGGDSASAKAAWKVSSKCIFSFSVGASSYLSGMGGVQMNDGTREVHFVSVLDPSSIKNSRPSFKLILFSDGDVKFALNTYDNSVYKYSTTAVSIKKLR